MDVGARIKKARNMARLTQRELAELIEASEITIRRWENGSHAPDISALILIADKLNTTVSYLSGEIDDPSQTQQPNLASVDGDPKADVLKEIAKDPRKFAVASLLVGMDDAQLSKAHSFLQDQKQLADLLKQKGA